MQLVETHCHIHSDDYSLDAEEVYKRATNEGITKLICVGTGTKDSMLALKWAQNHENAWTSIGVHPHGAKDGTAGLEKLLKDNSKPSRIVAIGETGLDYHYLHSSRAEQIKAFEAQLQLASDYNLPVIFHVREAFEDFWPVLSHFQGLRGVLHSYTDSESNMMWGIREGFYIGINGILTFTKDKKQLEMYKKVPLERLLLETDAPYLTPVPWRGKVNEPAYVRVVAEHLAAIKSTDTKISVESIAVHTTRNATNLFHF